MDRTGDTIGRFRVERLLGEGGIAQVYAVRHLQLGTLHALKLLTLQRPGLAARLLQEGRIQARLRHPNVVAVTDVVEDDGRIGLVMEYVEGMALDDCLADGAMPADEALELFQQILQGVGAAHRAGVLHRDLKPANILLTTVGDAVVAKVADFGIAKIEQQELGDARTLAGTTMGTPGYMAPEQVRDSANVDQRADVFALGAILYEMISGRRAFGTDDVLSILTRTAASEFVPLTELLDPCPFDLDFAVRTALAADPDNRFPDCERFARALDLDYELGAAPLQSVPTLPAAPSPPTLVPDPTPPTMVPDIEPTPTPVPPPAAPTPRLPTLDTSPPAEVTSDPPTQEELRAQFGLDDVEIDDTLPAHAFAPAKRPTVPPPEDASDDETEGNQEDPAEPPRSPLSEWLYELLWPLLKGAFHTARYIAFPVAALVIASVLGAQLGQSQLDEVRESAQVAEVQLQQAIEGGIPLHAELVSLGARAEVLAPFVDRYQRSDPGAPAFAAAADLMDAMMDEVRLLEATEDPAVLQQRRELEVRIRHVQAAHTSWEEDMTAWTETASSVTGVLAIRTGMAEAPPGWVDPFLGGE